MKFLQKNHVCLPEHTYQIKKIMKKTLLSFVAILALTAATFAQPGWIQVNSNLNAGQGVGQISVGMNNHNALWAYGTNGDGSIADIFTKSTDGGNTWTKGTFDKGTGLSQLFAIDENTCWAVFNTTSTQGLYKTTDGGAHWTKQGTAYGASSFADCMTFFNSLDGVAIGDPQSNYYEIYTTADGGSSWTRVPQANIPAPTSGEYGITGDISSQGNHVWFGTNAGRIFRSFDRGYTWAVTLTPFGNAETVAPEFADTMNGIVYRSYLNLGLEPALNITSDGGVTFTSVNVTGDMYARYFAYVPGTVSTYIGSSSDTSSGKGISQSVDGGYTWQTITADYPFQASAWTNDSTGWCGTWAVAKSAKTTGGMYIYDGGAFAPPTVDFTADYTAIPLGGSVTFTNETVNGTTFAWTFDGGLPANWFLKDPPAITYNNSGYYSVKLVSTNGYGKDSLIKTDYIYVGEAGINNLGNAAISIFPNPVKDFMTIQGNANINEITLFNTSGQAVISQQVNAKLVTISISGLPSGIYCVKVIQDNGTVNKKIIID